MVQVASRLYTYVLHLKNSNFHIFLLERKILVHTYKAKVIQLEHVLLVRVEGRAGNYFMHGGSGTTELQLSYWITELLQIKTVSTNLKRHRKQVLCFFFSNTTTSASMGPRQKAFLQELARTDRTESTPTTPEVQSSGVHS